MNSLRGKIFVAIANVINKISLVFFLTFAAILSSEVLDSYYLQQSAVSSQEQPINTHPTITLCFEDHSKSHWNREMYALGSKLTIQYFVNES